MYAPHLKTGPDNDRCVVLTKLHNVETGDRVGASWCSWCFLNTNDAGGVVSDCRFDRKTEDIVEVVSINQSIPRSALAIKQKHNIRKIDVKSVPNTDMKL